MPLKECNNIKWRLKHVQPPLLHIKTDAHYTTVAQTIPILNME